MESQAAQPFFTLVVSRFSPGDNLSACLQSIGRLADGDLEVIVADMAAGQGQPAEPVPDIPCRVIPMTGAPAGQARNKALEAAKGQILLFTRADCTLPPDLLKMMRKHFQDPDVAGVGCGCRTANAANDTACVAGLELTFEQTAAAEGHCSGMGDFCAAYRRHILMTMGGFNGRGAAGGQDLELCSRLRQQEFTLVFDPDMWVYQRHAETMGAYLGDKYRQGQARFRQLLSHPRQAVGHGAARSMHLQVVLALASIGFLAVMGPVDPRGAAVFAALCVALLYPLNRGLLRFVAEKEPALINKALFMCLLRPYAWAAGMLRASLARLSGG